MLTRKRDNLDEAIKIVDVEYQANAGYGAPPNIDGWPPFGALVPLDEEERRQLESLRDHIVRYVHQLQHDHPLCIAVFGPPGSGKSFAVKQILAQTIEMLKSQKEARLKLAMTTINLTQVADASELADAIVVAREESIQDSNTVPVLFFDEFDTSRGSAAYGWLSWFLAPMHDGEFFHNGRRVKFNRAIYVFAGGTAETMSEFADRLGDPEFRAAKGPDFVSRLRCPLNVLGPNADPRWIRRAIILRSELQKLIDRYGRGSFRIDQELLRSLLQVGRYRNGARSIAALIELSKLDGENNLITWNILPEEHLLKLQVDRGALDSESIGGSIAFSGWIPSGDTEEPLIPTVEDCWVKVASRLWDEGATLAYAGGWEDRDRGLALAKLLAKKLGDRPVEPSAASKSRSEPRPWFRSFLKGNEPDLAELVANNALQAANVDPKQIGIELVKETYLEDEDRAYHNWSQDVIERFRRRLAVAEASVARFVVGGDREQREGRPSGLVEEVVLSLALRKPVYLAGGFGGATADIGKLLGLSSIRTGNVPKLMRNRLSNEHTLRLPEIRKLLQPPPLRDLPVMPEEQVEFLHRHALGGPLWPRNGLTPEENRQLFRCTNVEDIAQMVVRGLLNRFCRP